MPQTRVKFGDDLELDPAVYELRRSGRALKLERIPMEILLLLVERNGQLVAREDIIARVWGRHVFLDTDNSINSAIRKIRQVLEDNPENPTYVQTVTGKGYRFIAPLTEATLPETHPPAVAIPPAAPPPVSHPSRLRSWAVSSAVVLCVLGMMAAAGIYLSQKRARFDATQHRVMLAVLPFVNLSDDPQQEYFSDGLTEETITDLGELNPAQLGLIARTSTTAYKGTHKTIAQIGRELGVDYVLEGSVRREGGVARISAQLIRVTDQTHLWAHTYDRTTGGLLALQNELGRAIAQQVQVKLAQGYGSRPIHAYAADPEAYELYLKGRFYLNKRTFPEIAESTNYFQQSIEKDPGFARAYAGLADSYIAKAILSPQEFDPKAKAAALRALELDDDLAEAHAVLGAEKADFEYDWQGAEQEFRRALALDPNDADAHFRYAWSYLTPLGKFGEAIEEMKKALQLDPFSRMDNTVFGLIYFYARRYDEALAQFDKAIKLNPDFFVTYYHLAWLDAQLGLYPSAITELTKGRLLAGDDRTKIAPAREAALKRGLATEGAKGFWRQMQKEGNETGEFGTPQVYARLGDAEHAMATLERTYEERVTLGTLMNVDPAFDSLRSDPRFQDLVQRIGLTPNPNRR